MLGKENRVEFDEEVDFGINVHYHDFAYVQTSLLNNFTPFIRMVEARSVDIGSVSHYDIVYINLFFLEYRVEDNLEARRFKQQMIDTDFSVMRNLNKSIQKVFSSTTKVKYTIQYNVKNTFKPFVDLLEIDQEKVKKLFVEYLDTRSNSLNERKRTIGFNVMLDLSSEKISGNRFILHDDASIYLKTSASNLNSDIEDSVKLMMIKKLKLDDFMEDYFSIYRSFDYDRVFKLHKSICTWNIYKRVSVFLESLKYINSNLRLKIKEEYLNKIADYMERYETIAKNKDIESMMLLSQYNEMNIFTSTYMFEQYIYGLLLLILVSGFSPLLKFLKVYIIGYLSSLCRKKVESDPERGAPPQKDYGMLSALDLIFERNVVAMDEDDYRSDDSITD